MGYECARMIPINYIIALVKGRKAGIQYAPTLPYIVANLKNNSGSKTSPSRTNLKFFLQGTDV
ncbi:MAG: hypothetical protein Kow0090_15260 [Myxococcota bacterium]